MADCPFERTVADNLSHAEAAIRSGRFDPSDCEPETFGPGGFENPRALLDWLKENLPPQDRTVTHGDFCLPNMFTDGKRFTGFIDVGNVGANDRWMDLALGWRSLKHNSDGHYGKSIRILIRMICSAQSELQRMKRSSGIIFCLMN